MPQGPSAFAASPGQLGRSALWLSGDHNDDDHNGQHDDYHDGDIDDDDDDYDGRDHHEAKVLEIEFFIHHNIRDFIFFIWSFF